MKYDQARPWEPAELKANQSGNLKRFGTGPLHVGSFRGILFRKPSSQPFVAEHCGKPSPDAPGHDTSWLTCLRYRLATSQPLLTTWRANIGDVSATSVRIFPRHTLDGTQKSLHKHTDQNIPTANRPRHKKQVPCSGDNFGLPTSQSPRRSVNRNI